jgi:hypothetical protein
LHEARGINVAFESIKNFCDVNIELNNNNCLDVSCLKFVVSKALGWLVLLGAAFVKVPQVVTILSKKSVVGLSLTMFLLEILGYAMI